MHRAELMHHAQPASLLGTNSSLKGRAFIYDHMVAPCYVALGLRYHATPAGAVEKLWKSPKLGQMLHRGVSSFDSPTALKAFTKGVIRVLQTHAKA